MIRGIVVRGKGEGKRVFGYPTANLDITQKQIKLAPGVYAATTIFNEKEYNSALIIVENPFVVEVHLLDFTEDLYDKLLEVVPIQKVSGIEKLAESELIKKIVEDIKRVREVFEEEQ